MLKTIERAHQVGMEERLAADVDATKPIRLYMKCRLLYSTHLAFTFLLMWWTLSDLKGQDQNVLKSQPTIFAAASSDTLYRVKKLGATEVNLLFSYYEQDGDHSPVTGGRGTEALNDYSSSIIVNVPLDSASRLTVNTSVDYYASASTDNINNNISSASSVDLHGAMTLTYTEQSKPKRNQRSITFGGGTESDYISFMIGASASKGSKDGNREWTIGAQVYFDKINLIFPDELRGKPETNFSTDKRITLILNGTLTQVINKKLQGSISTDLTVQRGLLSTPFHRVFFEGDSIHSHIEKLPSFRFKLPIGFRLNYFVNDYFIIRSFYRLYWDNFGILANTASLELPIKLGTAVTIFPFYRIHYQTAAKYFGAFAVANPLSEFRTSDYDLSSFTSQKFGLGLRVSPLYGIFRHKLGKHRVNMLKYLEFRFVEFMRSDGLNSFLISADAGFNIK